MSAEWDDGQCPRCGAGTLVTTVNKVTYRYCSYRQCMFGLDDDVIVSTGPASPPAPLTPAEAWRRFIGGQT